MLIKRDGYARADAGQCLGDHRTRTRYPLSRRMRVRARRAAHLDSTVEPASACSLPRQWRRDLRGRQHLASGAAELPECPIKALDKLVRGKFRDLLRRKCPNLVISDAVWSKRWILHVTAWGDGEQAVLEYLARYVFRIALTNARIVGLDDETVTIQYRERKTGRRRTCRLSGDEFMRRFLQHVLPRGFHKVRYFGLWHPRQRHTADRVRQMLQLQVPLKLDQSLDFVVPPLVAADAESTPPIEPLICPHLSGAPDLHPHALTAPGHGTMMHGTHLRRNDPPSLPRAPPTPHHRLSRVQSRAPLSTLMAVLDAPKPWHHPSLAQLRAKTRDAWGSIFSIGPMRSD